MDEGILELRAIRDDMADFKLDRDDMVALNRALNELATAIRTLAYHVERLKLNQQR